MWAISQTDSFPGGGGIDAWRHTLEHMVPEHYRSAPYFEKWCMQHMCIAVRDCGAGVDDMVARASDAAVMPQTPADTPVMGADYVETRVAQKDVSFARDVEQPPAFAVGDRVVTLETSHPGHTRLPAFARGATGEIIAHHGGHAYPDASAEGEERGEHLYTVRFAARDLWAEADARDVVCLDLWEPYLVSP